jgi:hypothetical protein
MQETLVHSTPSGPVILREVLRIFKCLSSEIGRPAANGRLFTLFKVA